MMSKQILELEPDQNADDTAAIVAQRESRYLAVDPLERLFRKGLITEDQYRVGRCLQADADRMRSMGGGSGLHRCGEAFVLLGGGKGLAGSSPQELAVEAAGRVQWARSRVGGDIAFGVLLELLQGFTPSDLDRRWFATKQKGTAKATAIMALERVEQSHVYERQRHRISIWAERAA